MNTENRFKRAWNKKRIPYFGLLGYSIFCLLSFFLPMLYSVVDHQAKFISGFDLFKLLEDTSTSLHYGCILFISGYVMAILILFIALFGLLCQDENIRIPYVMAVIVTLAKLVSEIIGIILLSQCQSMNLLLEFGSYLTIILSGLIWVGLIIYAVLKKVKRIK